MGKIPPFEVLVDQLVSDRFIREKRRLFAIDPGGTTGIAYFKGIELQYSRQVKSGEDVPKAALEIRELMRECDPHVAVMEDYRIYKWKKDDHTWSSLFTPRLIGAVEFICEDGWHVPLVKQMAQQPKQFVTDDKLMAWGLYSRGEQHARDAVRHACYHILFDKKGVYKA